MNFEELERTTSEHIVRHYLDEPLNRDYTCNWCYPPPPFETLSNSFKNFWNWFRREYQADTFTSRTIVAFNLFEQLSNTPESEHRNSRLIRVIYQLLSSIRYLVRPFSADVIYLYIQGISFRSNCFQQPITLSISSRVYTEILEQDLVRPIVDRRLLQQLVASSTPSASSLSNSSPNSPPVETEIMAASGAEMRAIFQDIFGTDR
jgi:hypothetical protein